MNNYQYAYTLPALLNPNERREFQLVLDNDSYFQVEKLLSFHTENYRVLIRDTAKNIGWSNIPIHCGNLFGTAQFPNVLQTPIILPPATTIYFDIENLTANPAEINITLDGYRIYSPVTVPSRRFYIYGLNLSLPALNIIDTNLIISNLGDFLVEKLVRYYDGEAEIRMSASGLAGRSLMSNLTHIDNLFGNALNPNILKHPFKLIRNSVLQVYLRNREAFTNNVQLSLEGSLFLEGSSPEIV